ncbi:MAG: hypothetical protein Q9165_008047 [Trypethelium subeluteriae]
MVAYRVAFHRTRGFPGPFWARVTKLYHGSSVRRPEGCFFLERLRQQYGDFVRTGPNEITIFSPDAVPLIHGPLSNCVKDAWYDNLLPLKSVLTTRSRVAHDARRCAWDEALSAERLEKVWGKIFHHAQVLEKRIEMEAGHVINVGPLFEYFGFDVMGDVHYSHPFRMLETSESRWVLDTFKAGTHGMGTFTLIPWMTRILHTFPVVRAEFLEWTKWAHDQVARRKENKPAERDPVSATISFLFYHLAIAPTHVSQIRAEMSGYTESDLDGKVDHLDALIYETLRLHPPFHSAGLRTTPPQGLQIGDVFVPGGTTVLTPQYSLHRREDCFDRANEFIPERWTTRPDMVKNKAAFLPWGTGPYACVGRNLSLMEVRTIAAVLLNKFDVRLAPGEDGHQLHYETLDCFVTIPGPLHLVFIPRSS